MDGWMDMLLDSMMGGMFRWVLAGRSILWVFFGI